jgi:hypothetical protein
MRLLRGVNKINFLMFKGTGLPDIGKCFMVCKHKTVLFEGTFMVLYFAVF